MITRRHLLHAIPFALLATFASTPGRSATAQELDTIAGKLNLAELDGIQIAVSRTWAAGIDTLVPDMSGTPVDRTGRPLLMLGLVAEFDSVEHVEKAVEQMRDRLETMFAAESTGTTLRVRPTTAFVDPAWRVIGTRSSPHSPLAIDGFLVRRWRWVTLTLAIGSDRSIRNTTRNLAASILDANPNRDEAIYEVSGQSHGGIWEKFPSAGTGSFDLLAGTTPIYDNLIVPPASPDAEG